MRKASFLDRLLVIVVYTLVGLLPIFILPATSFVGSSKAVLVSVGVFVALLLLVVQNLRDGTIVYPRSWLFLSYLSVVLMYLASAIASPHRALSFLGFAGVDSVYFMVVMLALVYIVSLLTISRRHLSRILALLFISSGIFALLQTLFIIAPGTAFVDALRNPTTTLIGSSSDMGIFFGLMAILSLITLELFKLRQLTRIGVWVTFVLSLFMLTVGNVSSVWYATGLFSLIVFVYSFASNTVGNRVPDETIVRRAYKVPMLPLALIIVSVVFILLGNTSIYNLIGGVPQLSFVNNLNITTIEARPSLTATFNIGTSLMKHKSLLGAGPGRFREAWNLYRPIEINNTAFWGTDFVVGFSIVAGAFVTMGILGALAWLWFIGTYAFLGFKNLLKHSDDLLGHSLLVMSFLGGLYLWLFTLIYAPGMSIVALAFIFTGFFVSSLLHERIIPLGKISITEDPRVAFAGVSGLVVLLVAIIVTAYVFATTIVSASYATWASEVYNQGDVETAKAYARRAINLKEDDGYYRFLANVGMGQLTSVLGNKQSKVTEADLKALIQSNFDVASRATALDDNDYLNWLTLGQVYQSITTPQDDKSYEGALAAYTAAQNLNPQNPSISLAIAQLERAHGDTAKAKAQIGAALTRKPDYTDAYFLLSQILIGEGSVKDAIISAEQATLTAPENPGVFFQLGLLRYSNKDYVGAAGAFERAISLDSEYANAQYFLGLSYDKLGRKQDAIALFEHLKEINPDNQDVAAILANLKAGRDAFSGAPAPTPEKAKTPPIKEKR